MRETCTANHTRTHTASGTWKAEGDTFEEIAHFVAALDDGPEDLAHQLLLQRMGLCEGMGRWGGQRGGGGTDQPPPRPLVPLLVHMECEL